MIEHASFFLTPLLNLTLKSHRPQSVALGQPRVDTASTGFGQEDARSLDGTLYWVFLFQNTWATGGTPKPQSSVGHEHLGPDPRAGLEGIQEATTPDCTPVTAEVASGCIERIR